VLLKHLLEQGLSKTAIAARLGISRRLVYHLITTGQLERDFAEPITRRPRVPMSTKIAPYAQIITTRLATYPELSAVRLFDECRAAGYTGGLTQLKAFVRRVRPSSEPDPIVRFETPPGHQAQLDFADFRFPWGKRAALMVVLGYSRLLWVRFYSRKTMRVVMAGLEEAFAYFGGVTHEVLFDQLRGVILGDTRLDPGGRLLEKSRVPPLRGPLAVSHSRLSAVSRQDQGEDRAARRLRPQQFRLRPRLLGRRGSRRAVSALARRDRECARARDDARAAARAL